MFLRVIPALLRFADSASALDVRERYCYNDTVLCLCPIRLEAQDVALSRPKQGFESPMGHSLLHLLSSWSIFFLRRAAAVVVIIQRRS
jgi:hypothetical protein